MVGRPDVDLSVGRASGTTGDAGAVRGDAASLAASSVPYPALFAWLFTPFTWPAPPVGFALWTGVNVAGLALPCVACHARPLNARPLDVHGALLYIMAARIPVRPGSAVVLLACAVSECYDALRTEHEVRAGLWLSVLIFRPQYAVLLGALLIWKLRWKAVLAAGAGVLLILVASIVVSSLATLLEFGHAIQDEGGFQGTSGNPVDFMLNWRR